jgi:carboxymethylenebutenolidase
MGMTAQILRVCERIAREGYLVAAPDLFHRFGDTGLTSFEQLGGLFESGDVLRDVEETLDQLRALGARRIGITGFCFGGRTSYAVATSGLAVDCAVPFYGGGIGGMLGTPTCPTLLLYGGSDAYIAPDEIAAVETHHPGAVVVYPDAGHGFFRDGSDAYDEHAAADAWHRLSGMLAAHLS